MSWQSQAQRHWVEARAKRALETCCTAMTPYLDTMESAAGQRALFLVSGFAILVFLGVESQAALDRATQEAQALSGIPLTVLETYAHYTVAMLQGASALQSAPLNCDATATGASTV